MLKPFYDTALMTHRFVGESWGCIMFISNLILYEWLKCVVSVIHSTFLNILILSLSRQAYPYPLNIQGQGVKNIIIPYLLKYAILSFIIEHLFDQSQVILVLS